MKKKMTKALSIFLCVMTCLAYSTPALAGTEAAFKDETQVTDQQTTGQRDTEKNGEATTKNSAKVDAASDDAEAETKNSDNDELPQSGTDDNISWAIEANGAMTISGSGEMKDYEDNDAPWSAYKTEITSVKFEEGITKIGFDTFNECWNLTDIDIPSTVTAISGYAFYKCTALEAVNLPANVASLGYATFGDCENLKEITINNNDISIQEYTFLNIKKNITIRCNPNSAAWKYAKTELITKECISDHAWKSEYEVDEKATPFWEGKKSIHCQNCDAKKDTTSIPKTDSDSGTDTGITWSIDNTGLLVVNGEGKWYMVRPWLHSKYQEYVTKLKMGSGLTNVDPYFTDYPNLKEVELSDTVKTITSDSGKHAFANCPSLEKITIPNDNIEISDNVFSECSKNLVIRCNSNSAARKYAEANDISWQCINHTYGDYVVDTEATCEKAGSEHRICKDCNYEDVEEIPATGHNYSETYTTDKAATPFEEGEESRHCENKNCESRIDVRTIPKTQEDSGTDDNISWKIDGTGLLTISGEGAMNNYTTLKTPWEKYKDNIKSVVVEEGVTSIGRNAFYHFTKLESVTLADSVTSIGDSAFNSCNVKNIDLPSGVTKVGSNAFKFCQSLEKVTVQSDTIDIADDAFNDCGSIRFICNPGSDAEAYAEEKDDISWQCINHTYGDYETDAEPTCAKEGRQHRVCSTCGYEDVETIPAKGHQWEAQPTVDVEATCEKDGSQSIHCKVCDATKDVQVIPAAHKWTTYRKSAGYLKDGTSYSYCTVCKVKKDVKTIAGYSKYVVKKLKVKKGKKSFKVTWKKASKANRKVISGYQIRYSKKSNMASSKYVKAGKSSKGKKIKKLSKKTKYYVQVRNYTKKGGKTYYSKWSGKKTVRTK